MAIRKPPAKPQREEEIAPEVMAYINRAKGEPIPAASDTKDPNELVPCNLKMMRSFRDRIDADLAARGGTNRTQWIIDACAEKLARSGH